MVTLHLKGKGSGRRKDKPKRNERYWGKINLTYFRIFTCVSTLYDKESSILGFRLAVLNFWKTQRYIN